MSPPTSRVPEKVRDLTTRPRLSPSARPDRLTEPQTRALRGILSGQVVPTYPPNFINAMELLIHADDTAETVDLVASMIDDPWRSGAERAFAATVLRRSAEPRAGEALAAHLDVDDPTVRIQVVRSLAAVGTADQLEALDAVEAEPGSPLEKQTRFARAVIAHREGIELDEPPGARGVARTPGEPEEMIELSLRPIRGKQLTAARARLEGSLYRMPVGETTFRLTAGKADWTVLTNAEMADAGRFGAMFDRPWLTALLARTEPRTGRAHVQYVVLSHPAGKEVRIDVFRTDGELMYTGAMKRIRDLFEFSIRDVASRAAAPTNVSGRITKDGPVLDLKVPFGSRIQTRSGHEGTPLG